ncbi:nitroreductase family deazaflavin-dependent oxidoreductase [Nocardioides sp. GY 10113]|uniref:nitroreductase/quinone reductase family protein n=1 Tax=Nocardioides sp. GY 10113 TaxID=2569761 RepID=UPI0010A93697|nr:nitroreductase/quinone reductase family protein [Nocardioides sp. GY 10113]TIC80469.1 nitroreductase family deazaflavin-dependent oxidoreductase [Nocardioides sp. GY 10113]
MSFESEAGTRGSRQPRGFVLATFNRFAIRRIRSGKKSVAGLDALVLTTVGRKTGERRSTPLGWFPGEDGSWVVVASANGAARNPAWYLNLAAAPDQVAIDVAGEHVEVSAVQLHGEERERAWQTVVSSAPRYAKYRESTDREIPLVKLTRRAA